jgi:hypothetical protein
MAKAHEHRMIILTEIVTHINCKNHKYFNGTIVMISGMFQDLHILERQVVGILLH